MANLYSAANLRNIFPQFAASIFMENNYCDSAAIVGANDNLVLLLEKIIKNVKSMNEVELDYIKNIQITITEEKYQNKVPKYFSSINFKGEHIPSECIDCVPVCPICKNPSLGKDKEVTPQGKVIKDNRFCNDCGYTFEITDAEYEDRHKLEYLKLHE